MNGVSNVRTGSQSITILTMTNEEAKDKQISEDWCCEQQMRGVGIVRTDDRIIEGQTEQKYYRGLHQCQVCKEIKIV